MTSRVSEDELDEGLNAILAKSDDEVMFEELHRLYNYTDDDSRQFTRHQMVVAIHHGFNMGKEHVRMLQEAEIRAGLLIRASQRNSNDTE